MYYIFFSSIFISFIKENQHFHILCILSLPHIVVHNRKLSQEICFILPLCVCVCVCVCLCVCLYSFTCWFLPAARRLWHTWAVGINDLLLRVFLGPLPSSFISFSESILFHHQRWKLQSTIYLLCKTMYRVLHERSNW